MFGLASLASLAHAKSGPGMLTTRAEFYCGKTWNYSTVNFQPNTPVKTKLLMIIYQRERERERERVPRTDNILTRSSPLSQLNDHDILRHLTCWQTHNEVEWWLLHFYFKNLNFSCHIFRTKKWFILSDRFWVKLNENPRWWAWKLKRNFFWCWLDKFYSKRRGASSHFTKQRFYFISLKAIYSRNKKNKSHINMNVQVDFIFIFIFCCKERRSY